MHVTSAIKVSRATVQNPRLTSTTVRLAVMSCLTQALIEPTTHEYHFRLRMVMW